MYGYYREKLILGMRKIGTLGSIDKKLLRVMEIYTSLTLNGLELHGNLVLLTELITYKLP